MPYQKPAFSKKINKLSLDVAEDQQSEEEEEEAATYDGEAANVETECYTTAPDVLPTTGTEQREIDQQNVQELK